MFFVTLPQASPVRQVLLTESVNINKNLLPIFANSAARLAAMQMQALRKQPVKPCAGRSCSLPACGQVSTAWPSLASGCLHSMNDEAEIYRQRCVALMKTVIKAVLEYLAVSEDENCNEKMLLVLCIGKSSSLLWLETPYSRYNLVHCG